MDKNIYNAYIRILEEELVPAMGCTEPIAIAYAAAKAREVLEEEVTSINVKCSGNIIKNAMCVTVPNTGNLVGIKASAIIGVLAGKAEKELEVINQVNEEAIKKASSLIDTDYCVMSILDTEVQLHLQVEVSSNNSKAMVEIKHAHNNITKITKNEEVILEAEENDNKYLGVFVDRGILNVKDIYDFANSVNINDVKEMLDKQIAYNIAIAEEGLTGKYGVGIGKVILENYSNECVAMKMKAYAAAASEARMSGSSMPVVTNSGSGNQGMTTSIPVIIYSREKGFSEEKLYRGLIFSNLMTIHQKTGIGRLSAFCGAVSAGCASGASITYLEGGTLEQINKTVVNTLANVSGIVCDGAKASCGAKIATTVDAAMIGHYIAMKDKSYKAQTGILKNDIEKTIGAVGRLGRLGMKSTDKEILEIMLEG